MAFSDEDQQHEYIMQILDKSDVCNISNKYTSELDKIVPYEVKRILEDNYNNGIDMKAVLCLFDTLLISNTSGRKNKKDRGLYKLHSSINKWIVEMKKLDVSSVEGFVYKTKVLDDIDVILKVPQEADGFDSMIREYFIGLTLNKLRYITPVFVYTLGSFLCSDPTDKKKLCQDKKASSMSAYVIYENVPGRSVEYLLMNDIIDYDEFMQIYIQILYGLEIAQRECQFTHFDLHPGNVMVREGNFDSYSFVLDDKLITVKNPRYIPVIIDFGMSSVTVDGTTVGSFSFPQYGMMNYMIPGYDAYKFLNNCTTRATRQTRRLISKLFSFLRDEYDPYDIWGKKGYNGIIEAGNEYCKKASTSKLANLIPANMIRMFMSAAPSNTKDMFVVTDREIFRNVKYNSMIKKYDDFFDQQVAGKRKAIEKALECISVKPSYITTLYNISVMIEYNLKLEGRPLETEISGMMDFLVENKPKLIEIDILRLDKVFNIEVPKQKDIMAACNRLFDLNIRHRLTVDRHLDVVLGFLSYHTEIEPYLDMYYTILELKIQDDYSEWVSKFLNSDIYKTYEFNRLTAEAALRWSKTLVASIQRKS
jgi:hypothetical protein